MLEEYSMTKALRSPIENRRVGSGLDECERGKVATRWIVHDERRQEAELINFESVS